MMALLGNYSVILKSPCRNMSGSSISDNRANINVAGQMRGRYVGWSTIGSRTALPNGYASGYSWSLAIKSGGMSSGKLVLGSGTISAGNLAGGLNAEAPLTGSGTISNADLALILSAVAALTGSGSLSGDINAILSAVAPLTGTGSLNAAVLDALAFIVAAVSGTGDAVGTATAKGSLSSDITVTGDLLSTANVGDAVWGTLLEAGFTADQIVRIIAAAVAGKSSGGPGSPVFRNLGDTEDQVSGSADSSGNRTSITYGD